MESDTAESPAPRQRWAEFNLEKPTAINLFHKAYEYLRERTLIPLPDGDVAGVVVSRNLVVLLDDLDSVLTLCSQNRITGAHKLLRSVFERVVTAKYLAENPAEVSAFTEFDVIHWHKFIQRLEKDQGTALPQKSKEHIEAAYLSARTKFRQEKCPACKRTPQASWTTMDMVTMASHVGLESDYLFCYLMPTLLLHGTYWGVDQILRDTVNPNPGTLTLIVQAAHTLLNHAISVHQRKFGEVDLSTDIGQIYDDWRLVWLSHVNH